MPGVVPQAEAIKRVPTPKLEVDVNAEGDSRDAASAEYESFLSDELDALKRRLLAHHNQQLLYPRTKLVQPREEMERKSSEAKGALTKVKAWPEDLIIDIIKQAPAMKQSSSQRRFSLISQDLPGRNALFGPSKFPSTAPGAGRPNPIWTKFALKETNLFRVIWCQAVVGFLIMYVATIFPYKLAFLDFRIGSTEEEEELYWIIIQWVVDVCFWIDLVLSFFCTYRTDEDFEVCDIRLIAKRYLTGMFILDLLACMPSQAMQMVLFGGDTNSRASPTRAINLTKLQRLTRILRILRLRQILNLAEMEWAQAIARFRGFRMFGLGAGVFWLVHLFGCGWYICGALSSNAELESWVARRGLPDGTTLLDKGPVNQWVHSCYFVLTVFTTVGFGDMSAFTVGEIIYVSVLMVVGGVVNGMVLSYVMNILEESDRKDLAIQKSVNTLKDFADHTQLSSTVTHYIVNLARQSRNSAEIDSVGVKKLFGGLILPRSAMSELPAKLWKGKLLKNAFFAKGAFVRQVQDLPPRLVLFVASMLKMRDFHEAGVLVYSEGDMPMNIFLVLAGTFAFVHDAPQGTTEGEAAEKTPYQLFGARTYFGEGEILMGRDLRVTSARCEEAGSVALLLPKQDMLNLCADFPAFGSSLRILAERREASRKRRLAKHVKKRTYEQFAHEVIIRFIRQMRHAHPTVVTVVPRAS